MSGMPPLEDAAADRRDPRHDRRSHPSHRTRHRQTHPAGGRPRSTVSPRQGGQVAEHVALAEVASVDRGKFSARPRNNPSFYGGEYPFIQTGDVTRAQRRTGIGYAQTLNDLGLAVSRKFQVGTIAVTIAANIADTAILDRPMCFPDSVVGVTVISSQTAARWNARCVSTRAKPILRARDCSVSG